MRPGVNGVIDNFGTIYSFNNAATPDDGSDGIDAQTNTGVNITNESTGVINGARHGITGGNTDVTTDGTFTMSVTNLAGGVIKGNDGSGINIDGFNKNEVVTVVNGGTITGNGVTSDGDGVDVDGLVNITNTGTIQSLHADNDTSEGVTVGGGTITNSGTIAGYNSATNADGTVNTGTGRGITLAGLDKDPTTGAAIPTEGIYANTTVDNSGLIYGQSDSAIAVTGAANAFTVGITNEKGGVLEGGGSAAVVSTGGNDATLINYGTIKADGTGKAIDLGSGNSSVSILGGSATVIGDMDGGTGTSTLTMTPGAGNTFSYGGAISNFSSVEVGAGSVALSGVNTYTGGTTIDAGGTLALTGAGSVAASSGVTDNGTLDISGTTSGTSVKTLTGSGAVTLGSNTLTLTDASGTFSGSISGTGGLTVDSGTATLTGISTYTGTTLINSGATLVLSSSGNIILANVVDDGTLQIEGTVGSLSGNGNVTLGSDGLTLAGGGVFGGTISGSGPVMFTGSQTLTGTNTYTGATSISATATLALTGTGSIATSSGVTDDGAFDISGTTTGATIQNLTGSGSANLGTKTLTLANASGIFSGAFTGSGKLVKQGSGALTLNGNSSLFTGTTEVADGLLEVGDANDTSAVLGGNVAVDANATLRGHGTVTGDVQNDGTVEPGGTIGTLSIGGNYAQASTATLAIEVSPTAASELLVGGTATLNGVLSIVYDPGTYTAKTYTLVSAAKGVSGTFSSVTSTGTANIGSLTSSVTYGANDAELVLAAAGTGGGSTTPVVVAPTATSIYTAMGTAAIMGAQTESAALLNHMGAASKATAATPSGWITATALQTKVGGASGQPGFQTQRYGFLAGLEKKVGDYTTGVSVGFDHTNLSESVTGSSGKTDTIRTALYGGRELGPVNLGATLGVGLDFLSQKRPFGAVGTAEGDHMGQEFNLGGQASMPMAVGSVTVTPRIGLRYAYFHANAFGESGAGGQDLNVATDNVRSLQPYVGVTLDHAFGDSLKPIDTELRLGYAHELLNANRAVSVAAQDGTLFTAPGTSLPRGYLTAGVGVTLHPKKNLTVSFSYDGLINTTHASAEQGEVHVGYQF